MNILPIAVISRISVLVLWTYNEAKRLALGAFKKYVRPEGGGGGRRGLTKSEQKRTVCLVVSFCIYVYLSTFLEGGERGGCPKTNEGEQGGGERGQKSPNLSKRTF